MCEPLKIDISGTLACSFRENLEIHCGSTEALSNSWLEPIRHAGEDTRYVTLISGTSALEFLEAHESAQVLLIAANAGLRTLATSLRGHEGVLTPLLNPTFLNEYGFDATCAVGMWRKNCKNMGRSTVKELMDANVWQACGDLTRDSTRLVDLIRTSEVRLKTATSEEEIGVSVKTCAQHLLPDELSALTNGQAEELGLEFRDLWSTITAAHVKFRDGLDDLTAGVASILLDMAAVSEAPSASLTAKLGMVMEEARLCFADGSQMRGPRRAAQELANTCQRLFPIAPGQGAGGRGEGAELVSEEGGPASWSGEDA